MFTEKTVFKSLSESRPIYLFFYICSIVLPYGLTQKRKMVVLILKMPKAPSASLPFKANPAIATLVLSRASSSQNGVMINL